MKLTRNRASRLSSSTASTSDGLRAMLMMYADSDSLPMSDATQKVSITSRTCAREARLLHALCPQHLDDHIL